MSASFRELAPICGNEVLNPRANMDKPSNKIDIPPVERLNPSDAKASEKAYGVEYQQIVVVRLRKQRRRLLRRQDAWGLGNTFRLLGILCRRCRSPAASFGKTP